MPSATAKRSLTDSFIESGSGLNAFVANNLGGHLDGGAGDDRMFWTGAKLEAIGGDGNDTLVLRKVKGAVWSVSADGMAVTLSRVA